MRFHFDVVPIEGILAPAVWGDNFRAGDSIEALGGTVRYVHARRATPPAGLSPYIIPFDSYNAAIARDYVTIRRHQPPLPIGFITLTNMVLFQGEGMLLDLAHGRCLIGEPFGISLPQAKWCTESGAGAVWAEDGRSFDMEVDETAIRHLGSSALVMSAPGMHIYGHWLLDYVPRLSLLRDAAMDGEIWLSQLPGFAASLLDAMGIAAERIRLYDGTHLLNQFVEATIPTFLKSGYTIDPISCGGAWRTLKQRLSDQAPPPPVTAERIFVSRGRWHMRRSIENIETVETAARERGYLILYPEEYSLLEQVAIFARARVVVGQDGSGLHNIMFCEGGARLGIINLPERCNLWHLAICDALYHSAAYVLAQPSPSGEPSVDLAQFHGLLDALEQA